MEQEQRKVYFDFKRLYVSKYQDVDTHKKHDVIICEYTVNECIHDVLNNNTIKSLGNYNMVIGEALTDIKDIFEDMVMLIKNKMSNCSPIFYCQHVNTILKHLDEINFSHNGYNILFNNNDDFNVKTTLFGTPNEIIIDPTTNNFSSIDKPFKSYKEFEEDNLKFIKGNSYQKIYKKVI